MHALISSKVPLIRTLTMEDIQQMNFPLISLITTIFTKLYGVFTLDVKSMLK